MASLSLYAGLVFDVKEGPLGDPAKLKGDLPSEIRFVLSKEDDFGGVFFIRRCGRTVRC